MVGSLILDHCLNSPEIDHVTSLVRKSTDHEHPKLKEVVISNFADFSDRSEFFLDVDVAFFCIGVYSGQVPDETFRRVTVDYAVAFAEALRNCSPESTLCFLSGAGADRTENSRMAFAKYKGMAENRISELNLGRFYAFRPGYIYPVERRDEPSMMYGIMRTLYPLIKLFGSNASIKSTELASAIFNVGLRGAKGEVLENKAILDYKRSETSD